MRTGYLVSLAIPIYGVEDYIERCVRSLFEQTYENIEYIFVNDCTKDKSIEILNRIMQDYPSRIPQTRIINHERNSGLACARNTAVAAAKGEFIMHIDSDDYVEKDIVELCVERQLDTNADIVSCNALEHKKGGSEKRIHQTHTSVKEHCLAVIRRKDLCFIWGRLIRTALYHNYGVTAESGTNVGEDYQTITQLIYHARKTALVNDFLYYYNHENMQSYTNMFTIEVRREAWRSYDIVQYYFKDKGKEYTEALLYAQIRIITINLIISGKSTNGCSIYTEAHRRLKGIARSYWKVEPVMRRIVLYLSFNFYLMRMYVRLSHCMNTYIRKIFHPHKIK